MKRVFIFFGITLLVLFFRGGFRVMAVTYDMADANPILLYSGDIWRSQAAANYGNNLDMTQVLSVSSAGNSLVLYFSTFTLAAGDTLFVYDGGSTSAPLLAKMTSAMTSKPH
ncbi:MAG: hypothetical protein LBV46_01805, partial [Bacteroidales bacterium]|nr:hypothetical protein [Bacteroidales bacterium]